jgi:hypothetical protein
MDDGVLLRERHVKRQLATASVLERRASSSHSAALAELLREGAARHRRLAERVARGWWSAGGAVRPAG